MKAMFKERMNVVRSALKRPRLRKGLAWLGGGIFGAFLALWLGLPWGLDWAIERFGSEALGRQISVERVAFNPFKLNARLEKLRIAGTKGQAALLEIESLDLNLSSLSLWHRGLVLDSLRIERPVLRFARTGEDRYSFSDIVDRLNSGPKASPESAPTRFSLNNIELVDGRVEFDDRPVGKKHLVDKLHIGIPFLSNLPARVELGVSPHLEARINGAQLKLAGQLKPFADTREASLDIKLAALDLTQYLGYAPVKLPVKLASGLLSSDLRLSWIEAQHGSQKLVLAGKLGLERFSVVEADGKALLKFSALGLDIERIEPLASPPLARISRVRLDQPELDVSRSTQGTLNLSRLAGESGGKPANAKAPLPRIAIARIELNQGLFHWHDEAAAGGFELTLSPVSVLMQGLDLASEKPAKLELKAGGGESESLAFKGDVNPLRGIHAGHLAIGGVKLERLRPYFQDAIGPGVVQAELAAEADLSLATAGKELDFKLGQLRFAAQNLAVLEPAGRKPLLEIPEVLLEGGRLDLAAREVDLGAITSKGANWALVRDAKGRFNLLEALQAPGGAAVATKAVSLDSPPQQDWKLRLGKIDCSGWGLRFEDRIGSAPVVLVLKDLGLHLADWSNAPGQWTSLALDTRVNKAGQLALSGRFASSPLQGSFQIDARAVDLLSAQPYIDQHYEVLLTRGSLSGKGQLEFKFADAAKPDLRFAGRLALDGFSSLDQLNDADFVQWKHLGLEGLRFQLNPLSLNARELRIDDFYTRLILDAQGRFNLRELANEEESAEPGQSVPVAKASAPAASQGSPVQVKIDKVLLSGGNINYSDRFVKPSYDARLAHMNGSLLGLSSDPKSIAQLDLKGAVDGSAPLTIVGQLNPLRQDRFLDLQAQVKGVDLTSVSTYAAKYVGYGISKGKLSMNLKYQIRDRKLTAENQLFLDQLTFGEKVDSPDATKLPVLFAVSLLKNRRGEIDINLPIGGSLDDPQFSVGSIVLKMIFNLIGKAVTAPFALIGSMFGGGEHDELSFVDFPPGKAELTPAAITKLQTLTKALDDRPALKLEITGQAEQGADMEGIKRARLDESLRSLKAQRLVKAGESVGDVDALIIETDEYPKLLEAVYSAEKIADKPRNALGFAKTIPVPEMEKLLLRHFAKDVPDLQSLASQRAKRVGDWLLEEGKISPDRIFLRNANAVDGEKPTPAPRALFSLK